MLSVNGYDHFKTEKAGRLPSSEDYHQRVVVFARGRRSGGADDQRGRGGEGDKHPAVAAERADRAVHPVRADIIGAGVAGVTGLR
jgi:hypothetical protein